MELKLFEDFLTLADQRSFSRAAQMRNVTQSALSKRIRLLESWLGAELVNRSSHPLTLTREGVAALSQSREIVQMMTRLRSGIQGVRKPAGSGVALAATHTLVLTFLPAWRAALEARSGQFAVGQIEQSTNYEEMHRSLRSGAADFLLTYAHPGIPMLSGSDEIERITLARERLIPVSAPDNRGAPLHALCGDRMVSALSYGPGAFFTRVLELEMRERPAPLHIHSVSPMCVSQRSMVLVGCAMAWLPEALVRRDLAEGRLVRAAGRERDLTLDVVLYGHLRRRGQVARFWEAARQSVPVAQDYLGSAVMN